MGNLGGFERPVGAITLCLKQEQAWRSTCFPITTNGSRSIPPQYITMDPVLFYSVEASVT